MGQNSKIEWTNHTFNPWIGCAKVSPGCANCYAEMQDKFRSWTPQGWGKGKPRKRTSESLWKQPLKWNSAERLRKCVTCHRHFTDSWNQHPQCPCGAAAPFIRPRVFCASLADWLDDEVPIEWLADLLKLIHETPNLDWLLLTKRPENWLKRLALVQSTHPCGNWTQGFIDSWLAGHPPQNIWLGTTAEDQQRWDERLPLLMAIAATVRFVSAEPLLGPIQMNGPRPEWLIVGGESGGKARPMHRAWVESLRDQCDDRTAFFFKQWGGVNKKAAGRELDGTTWDAIPSNAPREQQR